MEISNISPCKKYKSSKNKSSKRKKSKIFQDIILYSRVYNESEHNILALVGNANKCMRGGDHPSKDLAKSDHKPNVKYKSLIKPFILPT
jgi:predicted transcriptional regulator